MQNLKSYLLLLCIIISASNLLISKLLALGVLAATENNSITESINSVSKNLLSNVDFMARDPQQRPLRLGMGMEWRTAFISAKQKHGINPDDRSPTAFYLLSWPWV